MQQLARGRESGNFIFNKATDTKIIRPLCKSWHGLATIITIVISFAAANPSASFASRQDLGLLPSQFGTVIHQENSLAANQIYIVAQSHRSSVSGSNGEATEAVQAEIFRIGEWLVLNREVETLMPEGYFSRTQKPAKNITSARKKMGQGPHLKILDNQTLADSLADTSRFVTADTLMHRHLDLRLRQIEDRKIYFSVRELLTSLGNASANEQESFLPLLQYQQTKRSALILQNIPEVLDQEYSGNPNGNRNAMLTIGLAHVDDMVRFLAEGKAEISDLPGFPENYDCGEYSGNLNRLKEEYGIAVIVPHTLAQKYYPQLFAEMR